MTTPDTLDPLAGLRGMRWQESVDLINECAAQAGLSTTEDFMPEGWTLLHRVADAAHKLGAQGMAPDAKRYRAFRAAMASGEHTFIDKLEAAGDALGFHDLDKLTEEQIDAVFDRAMVQS